MLKNYIKNLETGKIELHFEKSDYQALTVDQKTEIKRSYLWSNYSKAWVSRSINNQWQAIETAKKLGFAEEERIGERLSFEEQLERKQGKAEHRADRYEQYAENANNRGKALQSELESFRGDIAFFTQPIISGHAGSQAFANRRERIFNRYHKGFEEYKKSEYFAERAETARKTADGTQLKSPIYLNNRIEECEKNIRSFERALAKVEPDENDKWQEEMLYKLEFEIDKLGYFQNCMEETKIKLVENGHKLYTKSDIKAGYLFKNYRYDVWAKVERVNPKTITATFIEHPLTNMNASCLYIEIKEIKIPEDWAEEKEQKTENPFKIGDVVASYPIHGGNKVIRAFQVVKLTDKTVTIQRIEVKDHLPVNDNFISEKLERKAVKQDRQGNIVVNNGEWYLYKYTA